MANRTEPTAPAPANPCGTCGAPMLGAHYHEADEAEPCGETLYAGGVAVATCAEPYGTEHSHHDGPGSIRADPIRDPNGVPHALSGDGRAFSRARGRRCSDRGPGGGMAP